MPYFSYHHHRLFYREAGQGPLLLILPGNTASSALHQGDVDYFGQQYHAVSLDFLGTGQSDRVAEWGVDWWGQGAEQARALIEHLGQPRALIMGTSGGAVAALLLAIRFPDAAQAVIADSAVERWPAETIRASIAGRSPRTPDQVGFWRAAHGDDWDQVVEADSRMLLRASADGWHPFGGRLGEIRCPVLITASLSDDLLPPDVGAQVIGMAAQIPDCRAFLHRHGGHPLIWSQPGEFRRHAAAFLEGLSQ